MSLDRTLANIDQQPSDIEALIPQNENPYPDPVITYFGELVTNENPKKVSCCRSVTSYTFKGISFIVGTLSGLPYIAPAMKFAGSYVVAGYILGYGVATSLAAVTTWSLIDVVNSFQSNQDAAHLMPKKSRSCIRETAYWTAVPALGISSSFPVAYLIYTYNSTRLVLVGISLATDSITNTCSLNRFYQDFKTNRPYYVSKRPVKNIERARWQFIHEMNVATQVLSNLPSHEMREIIFALHDQTFDPKRFMQRLLLLSREHIKNEEDHPIAYHGAPKYAVNATSLIFPLAWSIFGVINSYVSFGVLFDNPIARWLVSSTTNFPYLFLELALAYAVFNTIYESIIGSCYGTNHKSIGRQYYPKSHGALTTLGLFTTCTAFGSRAEFVTSEIPGTWGIALAVIVCISTVAYKSSAMLDLIKLAFEKIGLKFGDRTLKQIVKLVNDMREFNDVIKDTDPKILVEFIKSIENEKLIGMLTEGLPAEPPVDTPVELQNPIETTRRMPSASDLWAAEHEDIAEEPTPRQAWSLPCVVL